MGRWSRTLREPQGDNENLRATKTGSAEPCGQIGVAFFLPWVRVIVVAAHFPEALLVCVAELDPVEPLGALPEVLLRDERAHRGAVDRLARPRAAPRGD